MNISGIREKHSTFGSIVYQLRDFWQITLSLWLYFFICQGEFITTQGARGASLVPQLVKNRPAMQETPVGFQGWKDLLEKGQAAQSSVLVLPLWLS